MDSAGVFSGIFPKVSLGISPGIPPQMPHIFLSEIPPLNFSKNHSWICSKNYPGVAEKLQVSSEIYLGNPTGICPGVTYGISLEVSTGNIYSC